MIHKTENMSQTYCWIFIMFWKSDLQILFIACEDRVS